METELKLQVNQQAREQLQAHPLLKNTPYLSLMWIKLVITILIRLILI